MKSKITSFLKRHTSRLVDSTHRKFRLYPKWLIWFILFLSYNVLIQGLADVGLKVAGYTPWLQPLPVRVDFLFLTAVSILMGYQVLIGMRRRELDVTRNSIALGLLVELGLVVADVIHVFQYRADYAYLEWIRMPFIILTTMNFFILLSIGIHLKLFFTQKGKFALA